MHPDALVALEMLAAARGGYFLRSDVRDIGLDTTSLGSLCRSGVIRRIRHGTYVFAEHDDALGADEQYAVRCLAIADKLAPDAVLCGVSSAAVHGLPLVGIDRTWVDVVRLDDLTGRRRAGVDHRVFPVSEPDLVQVRGRTVTSPARAIWEAGVKAPARSALVLMDDALHHGTVTRDELKATGEAFASWKGAQGPRLALELADGRAESPGESVTRWMFHACRLPMPDLQYVVRDDDGTFLGRSDFAWLEHGMLGEFDGKIKYGRGFVPGKSPDDVVTDERTRERAMCGRRHGMLRFLWDEVWSPTRGSIARIRDELEWGRRRYL
ncbi:type IV toxin-antitoxin system AbiEi family antitoxin domain-containing protein [Mumia sp.]|uniref:type IV toxin-antitoxin system AbiEi family antitoxin domain-containing protein n=1 Tax=Mumia sp. TaxID=1965300 RepID=UPI0026030497|nr:type IV toxin-antitoxin system AbiEi family antitoxin domain-containing protein [Mumia sp.]MDD9348598.1 type IV toxin-antitoxin system AbiEi family antitoxin domain-containing protein [Mumia sp.]